MKLPIYFLDTFTSTRFRGNPTPVCLTDLPLPEATMQAIASELNLPVTAFVNAGNRQDTYAIHYFTTTAQIHACGHATLAAAKVMYARNPSKDACFQTVEQLFIQTRCSGEVIFLDYPLYLPTSVELPEGMLSSLGLTSCKRVFLSQELESLFIEVEDAATLQGLQPNFRLLTESSSRIKEVVVTCASQDSSYDYLLRSFCPWIGIDEDPVTGSVHSVLGPFWKDRFKKTNLRAYQASERGGEIYIYVYGNKVELGGMAILLLTGELEL